MAENQPKEAEKIEQVQNSLEVRFPHAVGCEIDVQNRTAKINRMEVMLKGDCFIPGGWCAKIKLFRGIDYRVTLIDTIVLPKIVPGVECPIGPCVASEIPKDIVKSEDEWQLELYIVDPYRNEERIFQSPSVSFVELRKQEESQGVIQQEQKQKYEKNKEARATPSYPHEAMCYIAPLGARLTLHEPPPHLVLPAVYRYLGKIDGLSAEHLYREQDEHVVLWFPELPGVSKSFLIDKYQITTHQFSAFLNDLIQQKLAYVEKSPVSGAKRCVDSMGHPLAFDAVDCWRRGPTTREPWHYAAQLWGLTYQDESWRPVPGSDLFPATLVTWWGARLYSLWAHRKSLDLSDEEHAYLPPVQEWQVAALWDVSARRQQLYPWGDTWQRELVNYAGYWADCEVREADWNRSWAAQPHVYRRTRPLPVASLEDGRSPVRCVQMLGNVWEWCKDDPTGNAISRRAVKGGACISPQEHCHPDKHVVWRPEQGNEYIGFRCYFPLS